MASMSEHRQFVRHNRLATRILSVQDRITFFPGPKLDYPAGAYQPKQGTLTRSIDVDEIAGLQDDPDAIHVFDIGHGNRFDLHPIAIIQARSIPSAQDGCDRRLNGRVQTKIEPLDPEN